jgi:hypothetical protein
MFSVITSAVSFTILVHTLCGICDLQLRHEVRVRSEMLSQLDNHESNIEIDRDYRVLGSPDDIFEETELNQEESAIIRYTMTAKNR